MGCLWSVALAPAARACPQKRLDVEDRRFIERLPVADAGHQAVDRDDLDPVPADQVGPIGRPRAEHAVIGIRRRQRFVASSEGSQRVRG
jgi:hypothetical protein